MASFTDAISQFNPYVQQLPVEAMVQVGMYKQQKYDEGVQKIQGYIDNIAGLDVIKPEHKQYLQSKLNQLGSDLRNVAAGDFSNQQLVNSVGGMTSQIIKDPNIQNAVSSTQQVRKQMSDREEAKKAGKSSIVNDWALDQQINSWLSDGNISSPFRGKYRQYIDVDKKLLDIAGKVPEIDSSVDQGYKSDAAGNTLYFVLDKDGKPQIGKDGRPITTTPDKGTPVIDEAIHRITAKGKSAPKLLSNFYNSLNEDDLEQLRMNADYHYQGANLDSLKKDLVTNFRSQKDMMTNEAVELGLELKTNSKLTAVERASMQARLTDINNKFKDGTLDKDLASKLEQLADPRTAGSLKSKIYTQNYLTNRAKDMANLSYKQTIESNPYMQVQMQYKQLQATYDRMRQEDVHWRANFAQEERQFAITSSQKEREIAQKERELKGLEPLAFDAPLSTDIESVNMGMLDGKIKDGRDAIQVLDGRYAGTLAKDQATPVAKKKFLDDLFAQYKMNPGSITDNTQREYLDQRMQLETGLAVNMNLANKVRQETATFNKELDQALTNAKGVTFANGQPLFSGKELFEVRDTVEKLRGSGAASLPGMVGGSGSQYKQFDADALVKRFKGTRMEPIAIAYAKQQKGAALTPTEQTIVGIGNNIHGMYQGVATNIVKKKQEAESELINRYLPERQTKVGILNPQNKNDQARLQMLMGLKADEYARMGALDTEVSGDYTPENFKALRESKTATYVVERKADGSAIVTGRDGDITIKFPVTSTELQSALPNIAERNEFDPIKFSVNSSPYHTTNVQGLTDDPGAAVSARYTGNNLRGLKNTKLASIVRYDIEGSSSNNGSNTDGFQVRLYVNDKGVWKSAVLNQAGWATPDGVLAMLQNIGPATINDVLSKK
jgi:hypothetical protein